MSEPTENNNPFYLDDIDISDCLSDVDITKPALHLENAAARLVNGSFKPSSPKKRKRKPRKKVERSLLEMHMDEILAKYEISEKSAKFITGLSVILFSILQEHLDNAEE